MNNALKKRSLNSETVYAFNIDKRELEIQDYDLFFPGEQLAFSKGFGLKTVSKDITKITNTGIHIVQEPFDSIEDAFKKSTPLSANIAKIVQKADKFKIDISDQLIIPPNFAAMLFLRYCVALRGESSEMFYIGSAQPSDYIPFKDYIDLDNVNKKVKVVIFSANKFKVWVYNASDPIHFPKGALSENEKVERYEEILEIDLSIQGWERAKYFGIFVHKIFMKDVIE